MVSVIVSKLKLLKIKMEFFFGNSMKFYNPFFGVTPKAFQAININLASGKTFAMIDLEMPIAAKHKRVINSEFVSVHDRTAPHLFYGHVKHCISRNVRENLDPYNAVSLENAEDRNLISGTPSARPFAPAAKIALIRLYFAIKEFFLSLIGKNSLSYYRSGSQGSRIRYSYLFGDSSCRKFKFKELYNPEPFKRLYLKFTCPTSGKIGELISASLTAIPKTRNSVYFSGPATYAIFLMVFPTRIYKIFSRFVFSLYSTMKLAY